MIKLTGFHLLGASVEDIERVVNSWEPKYLKRLEGVEFDILTDPFMDKDSVIFMTKDALAHTQQKKGSEE